MKQQLISTALLMLIFMSGCQQKSKYTPIQIPEWKGEDTKRILDSINDAQLDSLTAEGFFQWDTSDSLAGETLIIDHIRYIFVTEEEFENMSDSERRCCYIK